MKRFNLIGQTFGELTVIADEGSNEYGQSMWSVRCSCGREFVAVGYRLRNGKLKHCGHLNNLIGKKFNKLTVIDSTSESTFSDGYVCECVCDCGNKTFATTNALKAGKKKSCGCLGRIDLKGQRFGRLTVLGYDDSRNNRVYWKCICDCGRYCSIATKELRNGDTRSCGCLMSELNSERMLTHGESKTRLYHIWKQMRQRCNNPNDSSYFEYGEIGVKVCSEWEDYLVFRDWAVECGYTDVLSLDRINPFGDYCPENCKWSDKYEQARNKRQSYYNLAKHHVHLACNRSHVSNIDYVKEYIFDVLGIKYWDPIFRELNFDSSKVLRLDDIDPEIEADIRVAEDIDWFLSVYTGVLVVFLDWCFGYYTGTFSTEFAMTSIQVDYDCLVERKLPAPDLDYNNFVKILDEYLKKLKEEEDKFDI